MTKEPDSSERLVAQNRRASHDYFILETYEAGIVLTGTEVKSLRTGHASLSEAYATVENDEAFVIQLHIPPYAHLSHVDYQPTRSRKLLMHRSEIDRLDSQAQAKGLTLIPLEIYFKNGIVKVTVGLAKGKKTADRREEIKKRESDREIRRVRG